MFSRVATQLGGYVGSQRECTRVLGFAGISDFNFVLLQNHTPAALSCQVQIDIAALGSYRGPFGSFADLFGFLASNLPGRRHLFSLDDF